MKCFWRFLISIAGAPTMLLVLFGLFKITDLASERDQLRYQLLLLRSSIFEDKYNLRDDACEKKDERLVCTGISEDHRDLFAFECDHDGCKFTCGGKKNP